MTATAVREQEKPDNIKYTAVCFNEQGEQYKTFAPTTAGLEAILTIERGELPDDTLIVVRAFYNGSEVYKSRPVGYEKLDSVFSAAEVKVERAINENL